MKKKLISLFLAAAMTFSMFAMPINAFFVHHISYTANPVTDSFGPRMLYVEKEGGGYEEISIYDENWNQLYVQVGENEWEKLDTPLTPAEIMKQEADKKADEIAKAAVKKSQLEKAHNLKISDYYAQSMQNLIDLEIQILRIPAALRDKVTAQLKKMGKVIRIEDTTNTNHDDFEYGGFYISEKVQIEIAPFTSAGSYVHEYGHMVFITVLPKLYNSTTLKNEWNALKGGEGPTHVSDYAMTAYSEDLAETFDTLIRGSSQLRNMAAEYPDCLAVKKATLMRQVLNKAFGLDESVLPSLTPSAPSAWAKADIEEYQSTLGGSDEGVVPYPGTAHTTGYQKPATRFQFVYSMQNDMIDSMWGTNFFKGTSYDDYRAKWFPAPDNGKYPMPFTDVEPYVSSVYTMYTNGVINGKSATTFDPQGQLTRQEAATILYRLCNALGYKLPKGNADNFADSAKIAPWAKDAVAAISAAGIMNGVGNDNFDPTGVYTCEQSALTILRIYEMLTK